MSQDKLLRDGSKKEPEKVQIVQGSLNVIDS